MDEVRSIESIKNNAREAADRFHAGKLARPVNPCTPGTDGHKEWTAAYYERGISLGKVDSDL